MREPIPSTDLLKDIPAFTGFPPAGAKFLRGLAKNNEKAWFEKHRDEYEKHLLAPMRAFVLAVGGRMRRKMPRLVADPRVGSSIMRIARDIRFSADKSPYKTWIAARWWDGPNRESSVGFYFHIDADEAWAGGGIYMFEDDQLERYRSALSDAKALRALKTAIGKFDSAGIEIGGQTMKRPPRGLAPDHPAGELMLHKGFYAGTGISLGQTRTKALVDEAVDTFEKLIPMLRWLSDYVVSSAGKR